MHVNKTLETVLLTAVDLNHLVCQVMQLLLVANGLFELVVELFDALVQAHALAALGTSKGIVGIADLGTVALLLLMHIVGADASQ